MKKITFFIALFLCAIIGWGQVGSTTKDISINLSTGNFYKSDGTKQTSGYVAKWVSNEYPGLSFVYNNGSTNQFKPSGSSGVILAWNRNDQETYSIKLTEDYTKFCRLRGYTIHTTQGKLITVNAPSAVDKTFSASDTEAHVDYSSVSVTSMDFRNGTEKAMIYSNDATITIHLEVFPATNVTYKVKQGENLIWTSPSLKTLIGAFDEDKIPAAVKRPFTTLQPTVTEITAATTEVELNATFETPFDGADYLMKDGTGYYLSYSEGTDPYKLKQTEEFTPNYRWRFEGNPYTGVKVKSEVGNGYLQIIDPNKSGQTTTVLVKPESEVTGTFEIGKVAGSVEEKGIYLKQGRFYLNVHGSNKTLQGYQGLDNSSTLYVLPMPTNFKDKLTENFSYIATQARLPYLDLTQEKYEEAKALYLAAAAKDNVTDEEYLSVAAIVNNMANYVLPPTGYYRLKNKRENTFLNVDGNSLKILATEATSMTDPSTVVYVERIGEGDTVKYQFSTSGSKIPAGNGAYLYLSNTAAKATITPVGRGICNIYVSEQAGQSAWLVRYGDALIAYLKADPASASWSFIEATTLTVPLTTVGEASYATIYLPFDVTLPAGATKAYGINKTTGAQTELVNGVAKGTAVVLRNTNSEASVDLNIATVQESTTGSTELEGTYTSKNVTANSVLTFGASIDHPNRVGFFSYTGTKVPAFRAYITKPTSGGSNGFEIFVDDVTTGLNTISEVGATAKATFDLTGRRVKKATRGIFVVDGKKVVR